ncbi:MAG: thioredoxin [Alphaproteobacteria bacterium]|nr:thioredoxin [Alphaproteobacteria bacterium]
MATEHITDDNFDEAIAGDVPVIVDFWAEWCGPCKQMAPHLDAVAEEMSGTVRIAKINVDDNPMSGSRFGVRGLPTLMMFKDGKMIQAQTGAMSKQRITEWIKEHT